MKLAVEFPSVSYREGPEGVARLAKAIEDVGYDQLDLFDHVVMGYRIEGREDARYAANMPILEALSENFRNRGKRMDEAIELLQAYWRDRQVDYDGTYYRSVAMGMESKPPQGGDLPIWLGGNSDAAFRRAGTYGAGWLASQVPDAEYAKRSMDAIKAAAVAAGRDSEALG